MSLFSSLHPFFFLSFKTNIYYSLLAKVSEIHSSFLNVAHCSGFLPKDRRSSLALWGNLRSWWRWGEVIYKSKPNDTKQYELKLCLHVQWANWTHFQPDLWSLAPESCLPDALLLQTLNGGPAPAGESPVKVGCLWQSRFTSEKKRQERELLCK